MRLIPMSALLLPLALLSHTAMAQEHCKFSEPRSLQLDLSGVKAVVFEVGPHEVNITASANAKPGISGRACASDADRLKQLTLTQKRVGDKLVVTANRDDVLNFSWGNSNYAYLKLEASVPDNLLVNLKVGSGDSRIIGAAAISAGVGSGDVEARNIRGLVTADVGSGDIDLDDIGSLQVVSVGSGDLKARRIARDASVGSIGSGDVELHQVGGNVTLDSVGSGDFDVRDVRGNLTVRRVGSGSVDHSGVAGTVTVPRER